MARFCYCQLSVGNVVTWTSQECKQHKENTEQYEKNQKF